jgi:hypothetical protein
MIEKNLFTCCIQVTLHQHQNNKKKIRYIYIQKFILFVDMYKLTPECRFGSHVLGSYVLDFKVCFIDCNVQILPKI